MRRQWLQPRDVARLSIRMARWRASRAKRERMPAELWNEAVELARVHGAELVSGELGLDIEQLNRRLARASPNKDAESAKGGFVEVRLPAVQAVPTEVGGTSGPTVELSQCGGYALRVRLTGTESLDWPVLAWMGTLWGGRS